MPVAVTVALLVVYAATLARDVTFWDAGEFIAAASTFGIPHPPGTPLYVMLLRTALLGLGALGVPAAVATSLVSAVCTAGACGAGAALLRRATGDRVGAAAGGLAAGTMASVWLNATETEVYAASLALSVAIVWAAERAGRRQSFRWAVATAYLLVLAVPVHLSALLAAPAAVWLAAGRPVRPPTAAGAVRASVVVAASLSAFALGRMTVVPGLIAAAAVGAAMLLAVKWGGRSSSEGAAPAPLVRPELPRFARALLPALAIMLAGSALLVLLLRAQHDPLVNQGNPATLGALLDLVARRQYDVAALWPRQAPLWLQVGNLGLYADWQVAQSLGPTIFPTPSRTGATLLFALLGAYGGVVHRRRDPRGFAAFALLLLAGTLGAALYLNLKAGPSFGHGILPESALREARERDYFFVLGWWAWGAWAGLGAVALARRVGAPAATGVAVALFPALLNWSAVDRTRLPEAALPRATAEGLLGPLPPRAVLFVAGDNDTYPLWYAQRTLGLRPDVAVITVPLLPAAWYREELARRDTLLAADAGRLRWAGRAATLQEIVARAGALGRPVAMAVAMSPRDRDAVGGAWVLRGPVYVQRGDGDGDGGPGIDVDTAAARAWHRRLDALTGGADARAAIDGATRYMEALLRCPAIADSLAAAEVPAARADSLAPHCNFR